MTTSGKSADRKNRFTGPLSAQGTSEYEHYRCPGLVGLQRRRQEVLVQYADVGQVPVSLRKVEPVPDDELVRDLEAHVAHGDVDLAPRRLRQEGADLEAGGLPRLQVPHQVREREAGVDDVLDDEHLPSVDA